MSDWREWVEFALDQETVKTEAEQLAVLAKDPNNAESFYALGQLRRMQYKPDEGLALLLHAVSLDPALAVAHAALTELYAVRGDNRAAWKHARLGEAHGNRRGVALLERHKVSEK
ncbi:MAG: hypothetical protein HY820_30780 [Acidobacteria bacterium]|nr:hypothetical protein [Acidobacteriota bacterium]